MAIEFEPIVGNWYQHLDKGQQFEVVAVDEDSATIEIQHFDGDLEEVSLEDWTQLDIVPIEAPEDWTGPVDNLNRDDLGYTETSMQPGDWSSGSDEYHLQGSERPREAEVNESEESEEESYPYDQ